MLVFYSLVHSGESGKTSHEWLEGMECQLMLHILPLCFFPFGGVGKKALRGGKRQHVFEYWLQGSVCMFVCVCVENGGGGCPGLFSRIFFYGCLVIRHISGMLFCGQSLVL